MSLVHGVIKFRTPVLWFPLLERGMLVHLALGIIFWGLFSDWG